MSYALGVDALAPRYLREVTATEQAEGTRRGWRRRVQHADVLGAYPDVTTRALGADTASQDELTRLQAALHDLAVSIAAARQAGNAQAEAGLRAQFAATKQAVDALVTTLRTAESPSGLATGLASLADFARQLGGKAALVAALGVGALVLLPMLTTRRQ